MQDLDYGVPEVVAGVQFAAVPEQQGPVKPVVTHARLANPPNIVHTALFGKWDNCKNISLVRAATIEARLHARFAEEKKGNRPKNVIFSICILFFLDDFPSR